MYRSLTFLQDIDHMLAYLHSDCHNRKARASALAEPHLQHHLFTSFNRFKCALTMADTAIKLEACKAAAEVCGVLSDKIFHDFVVAI
jgi:hypothetical protein